MNYLSILVLSATATAAFAISPVVETPIAFRDAASNDDQYLVWKTAEPADSRARGEWWTLFSDPLLNELELRALEGNQGLHAAAARVEQARALAGIARSAALPGLTAGGSVGRERFSTTTENAMPHALTTTYRAPLSLTWEIDLFGRVRHLTASARADAQAMSATFESVRLALTADVAATYFALRALDEELGALRAGFRLRNRAHELAQARLTHGGGSELDVVRADTELASTEAEIAGVTNRRSALQNSLAVLMGAPAPDFRIPLPDTRLSGPPAIPPGVPAALLERRPDIAAAERSLAAASARIGVARAAFFPAISLTGGAGFASAAMDGLFRADSRVWSVGPSIYVPIFQGGRNRANLDRSRAAYEESVAEYRQQVLVAFREVQDALTGTRLLTEQADAHERALTSARRAVTIAQTRYEAGFVSYFEVIDALRTSLALERTSAFLTGLRFDATVTLVKALGGDWR